MKQYGDITKLSGHDLDPVDLIVGGSPCQDLSVAGKRAGLDGERSGLFMEMIRIIKEMRRKTMTDERLIKKAPIYKHGESLVHKDYCDGRASTELHKWADWVCPVCGWFVGEQYVPRRHNQSKSNYCSRCGQAIDWDAVRQME